MTTATAATNVYHTRDTFRTFDLRRASYLYAAGVDTYRLYHQQHRTMRHHWHPPAVSVY